MTQNTYSAEVTYGTTRSIERLVAATDAVRCAILRDVADHQARARSLALVSQALGAAVEGITGKAAPR
jgi:hypothetical protein